MMPCKGEQTTTGGVAVRVAVGVAVKGSCVNVGVGGLDVAVASRMVAESVAKMVLLGRTFGEAGGGLCEAGEQAHRPARQVTSANRASRGATNPEGLRIG